MLNLRTARMLGRKQRLSHVVFCLCWKWWATNHDMYCCPDCTSSSTHWHLSTPFTTLKSSLRSAVSVSQLFWYSNCNDTCMSFHTCAFVAVLRHVNKMATIEGLRPTSLHQNYPTLVILYDTQNNFNPCSCNNKRSPNRTDCKISSCSTMYR